MVDPVCPVLHLYVFAPLAVKVDDAPGQMAAGEALAVTLGDRIFKRQRLLIAVPQEFDTTHRYCPPFKDAAPVTLSVAVSAPLYTPPFTQLTNPVPLLTCH